MCKTLSSLLAEWIFGDYWVGHVYYCKIFKKIGNYYGYKYIEENASCDLNSDHTQYK